MKSKLTILIFYGISLLAALIINYFSVSLSVIFSLLLTYLLFSDDVQKKKIIMKILKQKVL